MVRLLANRIDKCESDSHVVVFDAWAHEGDPLRRSFLESLIEDLAAKCWIEVHPWKNRREELARRRRVEHTRPTTKLNRHAVFVGAGAALLALILSLGGALINGGTLQLDDWAFWVGIALHGVVLLAGVIAFLWLLNRGIAEASGMVLSLFSVDYVTESTRETIETPDPTSVSNSNRHVKELMCAALAESERRLVLVVDNLDRVSPGDARSIWATLQTFLHHSHDDPNPWLKLLWVLLPYDRAGINRLWDGLGPSSPDGKTQAELTLADSFIDKSVQVSI